jgi:Sec-independent protein translocase protein TatA
MGFLGHWWVLLLLIAVAALILSPSLLPRLGRFLGRRARETGAAGVEAGRNLREELNKPADKPPEDKPGH